MLLLIISLGVDNETVIRVLIETKRFHLITYSETDNRPMIYHIVSFYLN